MANIIFNVEIIFKVCVNPHCISTFEASFNQGKKNLQFLWLYGLQWIGTIERLHLINGSEGGRSGRVFPFFSSGGFNRRFFTITPQKTLNQQLSDSI
jgi:hypothetical protein